MNAVGKLGSFISQGVYTVSGTFHPFGGAVDIIVVQQEDGSFKSSPWYVRFGKFQGVLKTKQNVVRISVNDVEAGFTMFLDGKGEAFFLRDAEAGESEHALSSPTSGDEIEGMANNERCENTNTFEVDGGHDGIANISSQTSSRKSTFFGLMFGRKSIKENGKGGNMGRVSSLERAEIAADLLEMKWSTSMTSSNLQVNNAQVNILNNNEMNVHHVTLLPKEHLFCDENLDSHGEKMNHSLGTGMSSRYFSETKNVDDPSYLGVKEQIKNPCTEENYAEQNSEIVLGNKNPIGVQICDLGNAEAELDHAHMKTRLIENFDETVSHGNVQLCTSEVADSSYRNESISELVEVQSIDTDAKNPGSVAFHDDTSESHSGSGMDVLSGIPSFENRKTNNASFVYYETRETANIKLNNSDENCPEHMSLVSGGNEPCNSEPLSDVSGVFPGTSPSKSSASSVMGVSTVFLEHNLEASKTCNSFASKKSQHGSNINNTLETLYENTESDHIPKSEQILHTLPREPEVGNVVEPLHEKETVQEIDFAGCSTDLREQKASGNLSFPISISSDTLDSANAAESHNFSVRPSSCNSINVNQNMETVDSFLNMTWSFSLEEANIDGDCSSLPMEATEYNIQYSKSLEDVQFPFTDSENFSTEEINTKLLNIEKVAITNTAADTAESSAAEQDLQIKKHKLPPSGSSYHTLSPSSPIPIPDYKPCREETNLSSASLPIIRSHIKEFARYYVHQSLSWSPNSVADKHELDTHIIEDHSSLELKAEPQIDCINREKSTGTDPAISAKNEEPKGAMSNATAESSLRKNVSFEGTGAHAAQQLSDAEKGKLSDTLGMTQVDESVNKYGASRSFATSRGSWNLWPFFNRSKTISNSEATSEIKMEMTDNLTSRSTGNMTLESSVPKEKGPKKLQSLTPTTEELASLNLKEGKNLVKFSFSTPMLGLQQVDARIYLWKWNTQIIISDVDGTITKSDVLGQFMPLMGVDWSQTGVTHLFSAIKENGYQLLFLSARAISQAHLTRQFLFNLKQDGKALPDGPVFLSPDGLFPSLYREVIRRAPHEFKISCLEAIKSLFPPHCNPFYAGFGNRDTDEISYLKVGVPPSKVFIINPKGQIAVNRRANTRSYASLRDLVNGVFPPVSSFEQEDYNSWNYWKLPLPKVDI